MTPRQKKLADLMSEISERHFAAGWMDTLEFDLWEMLLDDTKRDYGFRAVPEEDITKLRELSDTCSGWCIWAVNVDEVRFVTFAQWAEILGQRLPAGTPQLKIAGPAERDVAGHLKRRVKERKGHTRRVQWINQDGAPDFFVVLSGVHAFVETKPPGGDATPAQAAEHEMLRTGGCTVLVLDTINKVDAWLNSIP